MKRKPLVASLLLFFLLDPGSAQNVRLNAQVQHAQPGDLGPFAHQLEEEGSLFGESWLNQSNVGFLQGGATMVQARAIIGPDGMVGGTAIAIAGTVGLEPSLSDLTTGNGLLLNVAAVAVDAQGHLIWSAKGFATGGELGRRIMPGEQVDYCIGQRINTSTSSQMGDLHIGVVCWVDSALLNIDNEYRYTMEGLVIAENTLGTTEIRRIQGSVIDAMVQHTRRPEFGVRPYSPSE